MNSATYSQLLSQNKNFRRLWIGQVISELGNWFNLIAELGLARSLSGTSLAATAVLVSRMGPFVLFAPFAGVLVDRFSRRKIMIAADLMRAMIALGYLFVNKPGQLWIAYASGAALSAITVFFDGAKSASLPNLTKSRELLPANALMHSTRFLQLTLGAATGGVVSEHFGYKVAFIVNSLSFLASAFFIWRIPEASMTKTNDGEINRAQICTKKQSSVARFFHDIRLGFAYIWKTPLILGFVFINLAWATGGGATNLIYDRFGGHIYRSGAQGDMGVAILYTSVGLGLVIGMFVARWVGVWVEQKRITNLFIGISLVIHGLFFAAGGLMNGLFTMAACIFVSRLIIGTEFAIQETMMMRVIPDELRGRVFITDRSLEFFIVMLSMLAFGYALNAFPPKYVVIVSGLLSASPGLVWLIALWSGKLKTQAIAPAQNTEISPSVG